MQRWEQYSAVNLVIYANTRAKHVRYSVSALQCSFQLTHVETLGLLDAPSMKTDMLEPIAS